MNKRDRDRKNYQDRMRKIEQKGKEKGGGGEVAPAPSPSSSLEASKDEPSGLKLRITYLAGVPKKDDVGSVGDVLAAMGKSRELAETAHNSRGKARLPVYKGYSKPEANEIARQLEDAGAKLVRC